MAASTPICERSCGRGFSLSPLFWQNAAIRFWSSGRLLRRRTLRSMPTCSESTPPGNNTEDTRGMIGRRLGISKSIHSEALVLGVAFFEDCAILDEVVRYTET